MILRRHFLKNSASALIGFSAFSLFSLAAKYPDYQGTTEKILADLEESIPILMRRNIVPGISIAIVKNQNIIFSRSFGVKNKKTQDPVDNDTVFAAASLGKPLFAYTVLKMCEQGLLNLDTPLTEYTNKPYIKDTRIKQITTRMVLSHTTGFPNWSGDAPVWIERKPGSKFSYSGEGYIYLQKVVEEITKQPLNEYITAKILQPLAMNSSSYIWLPSYNELATNGHNRYGKPLPQSKPKHAVAAGSLRTTANDYAQLLLAMMETDDRDNNLLTLKDTETMVSPQIKINPLLNWGLGWGLENTPQGSFFWHWGDGGIFKSFTLASRQLKIGLVILTNSENGLKTCREIVRICFGEQHPALNFSMINY